MLFQRSTEVAIHALVFLAQQAPGKLSPTHEIAAQVGVPEAYLAKVLQKLTASGLIRAFRGSGKGVELGKPAENIPLSAVIVAAQGTLESDKCILGLSLCSEENPCSLHHEWLPHRAALREMFERTTVSDLVQYLRRPAAGAGPPAQAKSVASAERSSESGWRE